MLLRKAYYPGIKNKDKSDYINPTILFLGVLVLNKRANRFRKEV